MLGRQLRFSFCTVFVLVWNILIATTFAQKAGEVHEFDLSNPAKLNDNWGHDYNCNGITHTHQLIRAASHIAYWDPKTPLGAAWVATTTETGSITQNYKQYQYIIREDKAAGKINLIGVYVLYNSYKNYNDGKQCTRL